MPSVVILVPYASSTDTMISDSGPLSRYFMHIRYIQYQVVNDCCAYRENLVES